MDHAALQRFVDAQQGVYPQALAELRAGAKRSHWMWFVFPQLRGLGSSAMAQHYGLGGLDEARAYRGHPVLGPRLVECTAAMLAVQGRSARQILGTPDDLKFRSCMTLFDVAAPDEPAFAQALAMYFDGRPDERTLALLAPIAPPPVRQARALRPGQRAELRVVDVETGVVRLLLTSTTRLFEAPNWHPDGRWIVLNADGLLFRVDVEAPTALIAIPTPGLPELNNDHLVSPDGRWHYLSANDGHIYRMPWAGGTSERITAAKDPQRRFRHFLHGISPDGRTLAYVGTEARDGDEWGRRALWLLDRATGHERLVGDGCSPADGPDFSPDGRRLFFNSEMASSREGHAQLFACDLEGGAMQQLTADERVNWFPHPSPDGRRLVYLSYEPGTPGHPADRPVLLRLLDLASGERRDLAALPGGQGTLNVPSWAPDGRRLAFVAYPG